MKKSIKIATLGVAALGFAAAPVLGASAADQLSPITDTVTVTINSACSLSGTGATPTETMTNNQLKSDFAGSTLTIQCNDAKGWHLTAVGAGDDATNKTAMNATGTGTDIATGTATSGASNWAFKVAGDKAEEGYKSFMAIPSTATDVASDTGAAVGVETGTTITSTYQVWISDTQQADTYTGKVTYTLAHPQA